MCLGDLHELPRDGAAWLQDSADGAVVVVALARPHPPQTPRFTAAEARRLAAELTALADQLEAAGSST